MGVKGLFPFLRSVAPQCIESVSIESLRGKRIAIDGNLLLYREYTSPWLPVSQPKKHILWAIRLLRLCREYQILPIVVFDSPLTTPAKARERVKRTIRRDKIKTALQDSKDKAMRLQGLASTMKEMESLDSGVQEQIRSQFQEVQDDPSQSDQEQSKAATLAPVQELLELEPDIRAKVLTDPNSAVAVANLAQRLVVHMKQISTSNPQDVAGELALLIRLMTPGSEVPSGELQRLQFTTADIVEKLTRRVSFPRQSEIKRTWACLHKFKIPVQISPPNFEGECTAASFVRADYADYVATDDSDVLVYGVPQLRGFMAVHGLSSQAPASLGEMKIIDPTKLRASITKDSMKPWSEATFRDFAILCGTDFSQSINGLGVTKAAQLLDEHRSLDEAVKHIPEIVYKNGPKKGQSRYTIHETFEIDRTVAETIFTSYPVHKSKQMTKRLHVKASVDRTLRRFQRLWQNAEEWTRIEHAVMHEEQLSADDLSMLDNADIYRQNHKKVKAPLTRFSLNDDPDRVAATESGFKASIPGIL